MDELILNNYAALAVSIMRNVPPEVAFEILEDPYKKQCRKVTEEEKEYIVSLYRQGKRYCEIAMLSGRERSTVKYILITRGELKNGN